MGKRGEGWFLIQLALFALILLSSRIGLWVFPVWLRLLGGVLLVIGGIAGTLGILALGRNLSPFPKPIEGGALVHERRLRHRPPPDLHRADPGHPRLGTADEQRAGRDPVRRALPLLRPEVRT